MNIFLISQVRNTKRKEKLAIDKYVAALRQAGYKVHWPLQDTAQTDPYGGYMTCATNFFKLRDAQEVHVWFQAKSEEFIFNLGMLFALLQCAEAHLGIRKRVVVINIDALHRHVLTLTRKEVAAGKDIQNDFSRVLNELATRYA